MGRGQRRTVTLPACWGEQLSHRLQRRPLPGRRRRRRHRLQSLSSLPGMQCSRGKQTLPGLGCPVGVTSMQRCGAAGSVGGDTRRHVVGLARSGRLRSQAVPRRPWPKQRNADVPRLNWTGLVYRECCFGTCLQVERHRAVLAGHHGLHVLQLVVPNVHKHVVQVAAAGGRGAGPARKPCLVVSFGT